MSIVQPGPQDQKVRFFRTALSVSGNYCKMQNTVDSRYLEVEGTL